jgi:hypothetical protein
MSQSGQHLPNSGACAMSGIASTSEVNSEEVYCEPNSRLVLCRVRHPMGAMSDDQNMVTRTKCYLLRDAAGDSRAAATHGRRLIGIIVSTDMDHNRMAFAI